MDQYEKLKVLGKGSFGEAILVRERGGARRKLVVKCVSVDPGQLAEARHEAKVLTKMEHSNIVTYLNCFAEKGGFFIVME